MTRWLILVASHAVVFVAGWAVAAVAAALRDADNAIAGITLPEPPDIDDATADRLARRTFDQDDVVVRFPSVLRHQHPANGRHP